MGFPANLRRFRKAARLTQEELAHACGWSGQSRIANYEAGKREPTLAELTLLVGALEVSYDQLLGSVNGSAIGTPNKSESPTGPLSHLATLDRDILHEALTLLLFDLDHGGMRTAGTATPLLMKLYERIQAAGGQLPADEQEAFEMAAMARGKGRLNDGNELARRRAAKRRRK